MFGVLFADTDQAMARTGDDHRYLSHQESDVDVAKNMRLQYILPNFSHP